MSFRIGWEVQRLFIRRSANRFIGGTPDFDRLYLNIATELP